MTLHNLRMSRIQMQYKSLYSMYKGLLKQSISYEYYDVPTVGNTDTYNFTYLQRCTEIVVSSFRNILF